MEDNETANLDKEFKRYLQLLRPYLGQLLDENVIKICDAWIQRLTDCKENEKALRNKYIFLLCYQLAKGVIGTPFINDPPIQLKVLLDDINSEDELSEVEYVVINSNTMESKTKVLFNSKKVVGSETEYTSKDDIGTWDASADSEKFIKMEELGPSCKQRIVCYPCPQIVQNNNDSNDEYEIRANNLVKKLRELKMQNMLLQKELIALKVEDKSYDSLVEDRIIKVDNKTSPFICNNNSNVTLKSLKCQLQEMKESKNILIETITHLQNQLDNLNESKNNQIEDIEAKHKLELIKVRTDTREETKSFYENKIEDLKQTYEDTILKIQEATSKELKTVTNSRDKEIFEKNMLLDAKNKEIDTLKNEIETQKTNIKSMLDKIVEISSEEASNERLKIKNQLLEKRLNKLEKSKNTSARIYEAKVTQIQREKHLVECSLQLQLVRQRAQVVSELTDENQTELNTSLEKLENKYKDIVANVQATAIQRRIQDQRALELVLQAVCDIDDPNQSTITSNPARNHNNTYDSENISLNRTRSNRIRNMALANKSFGENSTVPGFCLSSERMGELFERVYIPQKDNTSGEIK